MKDQMRWGLRKAMGVESEMNLIGGENKDMAIPKITTEHNSNHNNSNSGSSDNR